MPVPKLEEYKAPWEMKDGQPVPDDEQVVDKDALKKYLHGLLSDKERLQTSVTTVTAERDELKQEQDAKQREGESEIDRLKRENAELAKQKEEAGKTSIETLRLRAALKVGLPAHHVDRLIGTTLEELEEDAKKLKADFGGSGQRDEEDDDADETPRRRPKPSRTGGDPRPDEGSKGGVSVEKMLEAVPSPYML